MTRLDGLEANISRRREESKGGRRSWRFMSGGRCVRGMRRLWGRHWEGPDTDVSVTSDVRGCMEVIW